MSISEQKSAGAGGQIRTGAETAQRPYVDWGAIFAGAVVAAAVSALLTAFGAAIGLSAVSPVSGKGFSATAISIATALWILWIAVSSFVTGGYLAGRLRHRVHDASEHESDVRDGAHGLIVWAIGALLISYLATASVAGLAKAAAGGASALAGAGQSIAGMGNPAALLSDRLWRSAGQAAPAPNGANDWVRQDAARILGASALSGSISDDDKSYLAAQVASQTGLTAPEAAKRVDETMAQVSAAAEKARQAAETARRVGVLAAFLTAASLAISAAAAWWAATMGGKHRDEGLGEGAFMAWR